jgi:uncharacterized membrane protein YobD (UPF0266 family)
MGSNSVLLWAVILVGLLITFLKLSKVIISESIMCRDRDGAAGGGLLIYVRDGIGITRIRNIETPLDETIWILIQDKGLVSLIIMGSNSVLLWAVILVGLLIPFFKLNRVIISESLLF